MDKDRLYNGLMVCLLISVVALLLIRYLITDYGIALGIDVVLIIVFGVSAWLVKIGALDHVLPKKTEVGGLPLNVDKGEAGVPRRPKDLSRVGGEEDPDKGRRIEL